MIGVELDFVISDWTEYHAFKYAASNPITHNHSEFGTDLCQKSPIIVLITIINDLCLFRNNMIPFPLSFQCLMLAWVAYFIARMLKELHNQI